VREASRGADEGFRNRLTPFRVAAAHFTRAANKKESRNRRMRFARFQFAASYGFTASRESQKSKRSERCKRAKSTHPRLD
jgi:hypothetical protein